MVGYLYLGIFSELCPSKTCVHEANLLTAGTLLNFTTLDKALSPLHIVEMILKPSDEQGKQSPKAQHARRTRDGEMMKLLVMRKTKKPCYWPNVPLLCGNPSPSSGPQGFVSQVLPSSRELASTKYFCNSHLPQQ